MCVFAHSKKAANECEILGFCDYGYAMARPAKHAIRDKFLGILRTKARIFVPTIILN
jgi:hypothetical protein